MIDITPSKLPERHHRGTHKFREWMRTHPRYSLTFGSLLTVLIGLAVAYTMYVVTAPTHTPQLVKSVYHKPKVAPKYYSPLTGKQVTDEAATKRAVTGIMIENSPDARPQSGLKQAGVVYEAVAEGGITRFLALYQEDAPKLIGPVRSLRMYFLDWATPYQASITHFGGSLYSLREVGNGKYRNLDLMASSTAYYWRATDRYAPHNVYTTSSKLDALNKKRGYTTSTFTAWSRQDGKASDTPNARTIDIKISSVLYNPHYVYNAKSNTYLRYINGQPSNDREDGQLSPSVVIAIKVNMKTVMQDGYREEITTSGSGSAIIFQNGIVTKGTWHKTSRTGSLTFTDTAGKEIPLNRGQTWVAAVPNGSGSITWQ